MLLPDWKCVRRRGVNVYDIYWRTRVRYSLVDPTLLMRFLISGTREPPSSVSYVFTDSRSYTFSTV